MPEPVKKKEVQKRAAQPPVLDLPAEKKPYPFVIQEHTRGKSSHLDMRFALDDHLIGFTLDDPGRVGDPFKLSNDAEQSSKNKILVQAKGRQPKAWLKVAGDIEPGGVGATKNLPARFKFIDKGRYEMGAQRSDFLEVFLKGRMMKGRFMFRKLPRPSDSEMAGKKPLVWCGWKPVKQRPFVLSRRALNEKFVPPKGRSTLSKEWENKIPSALRWWDKNWTGSQALSAIEEIRKILLKRNILTLEALDFTLQRRDPQGQEGITELNISSGTSFDLDANPLVQKSEINAVKKTSVPENINFVGHVEILDKGKVNRIESTENFISLKFSGSKLRGFWTLKKKDTGWVLEKSQEATKPKKIENIELTESQLRMINVATTVGTISLSQIADSVGCSKSTVMYQQKKMGLR